MLFQAAQKLFGMVSWLHRYAAGAACLSLQQSEYMLRWLGRLLFNG